MHSLRLTVGAFVAATLVACGARTGLDDRDGDRAADAGFAPHPTCVSASGVRLCGGSPPCPELPAPTCRGFGCQHSASIVNGATATGGACLTDLSDNGLRDCSTCNDGEACLSKTNGDLVCVPLDVCHALWDIGVRDVCRYADKSPYDDRPLAVAESCPLGISPFPMCGSGCASCPPDFPCSGRSATRPYGLCQYRGGNPNIACSFGPLASPKVWCSQNQATIWNCAVYRGRPEDQTTAMKYGTCVGATHCQKIRDVLGVDCYDYAGTKVP